MGRTRADRGDWDMHPSDVEPDELTSGPEDGGSVYDREAADQAADDYEADITKGWDP